MISFSCNSDDLKKVLQSFLIQKIHKSPIKFEVKNNEIIISSYTREISLEFKFKGLKVVEEGVFNVDFSLFLNSIKDFKNEELNFVISDNIKISSKKTKISLTTIDFPEYQKIDLKDFSSNVKIEIKDLINVFKKIVVCVSNQIDRPALTGILVHKTENAKSLSVVGTDGRKLSIGKFDSEINLPGEFLFPKKILEQIDAFSQISDCKSIDLNYNEKGFILNYDNFKIKSFFIDGKFPNYRSILVSSEENYIDINTRTLISSLRKASNINDLSLTDVNVTFLIKEDNMFIKLKSSFNEFEEEIDIKRAGLNLSSDIQVNLHLKSIIEIISAIETEFVRIVINNEKSPILIKPIGWNFDLSYILALSQ